MKVALLTPGPSLCTWAFDTFAPYDLRVGVNRAVLYAFCDAWVAMDWKLIARHAPAVPLTIYTDKVAAEHLTESRFPRLHEFPVIVVERRGVFSAVNALHICKDLGATAIDVYGADWTDQPDFDGTTVVGSKRDAERWTAERAAWDATVNQLGIEVKRIGTDR